MFTLIISGNYEEDMGIFFFSLSLFASQFHSVLVRLAQPTRHQRTPADITTRQKVQCHSRVPGYSVDCPRRPPPPPPGPPHLTVRPDGTNLFCSVVTGIPRGGLHAKKLSLWGTFPSASLVYNHDFHHRTLAWQSQFGSMQYDEIDKNCSVAWNWNPTNRKRTYRIAHLVSSWVGGLVGSV